MASPIYATTSTYNSADELIYITNPDATYTYTYDELGRMLTVDNAGTPDVANVVLTYGYDEKSNIISVADSIDGVASGLTTYEYDKIDRLVSITQSGNGVEDKRVDFDYNSIGQYSQIDRGRGNSQDPDLPNNTGDPCGSNPNLSVPFFSIDLEENKQGKHQKRHRNYIPGRSVLTHPNPQELLNNFAGKGLSLNSIPLGDAGSKERVNFKEKIGDFADPNTSTLIPTQNGIIHYSKNGAHIVPSRP